MEIHKLLGVKYPIIQGGMANIATGKLAAAVSNAGGLGLVATGGFSVDELREQIEIAKKHTDRPFGVNLMLMHPQADQMAALFSELKVPVVTTGAGNPAKYIEDWKKSNILVFPVVPNPTLAVRMERLGVDGVIAEGAEAGGHIGEMTTMTLIPQVVDRVRIPVVAAGGIASGQQMLAAEVLGASGIQVGTCLLAAYECPVHANYKEKILKSNYSNITVIGRSTGLPVRLLKNKMCVEYTKKESEGADVETLEHYTLGSLRRAVQEGDVDTGSLMAGLVVTQVRQEESIREILDRLMREYQEEVIKFSCKR